MLKRYCITYVGNDSCNHREIVWAADHNAAVEKMTAKDADMVVCVRRTSNPYVIAGIILAVLALIAIEIVR